MRLPYNEREEAYLRVLAGADWPVKVCKLADIYDNLGDCRHLTSSGRQWTFTKSHHFLNAIRQSLPEQGRELFQLVEERLATLETSP